MYNGVYISYFKCDMIEWIEFCVCECGVVVWCVIMYKYYVFGVVRYGEI